MLIEEMMLKRDIATNVATLFQGIFGGNIAGIFYLEQIEECNNLEFREYILKEMTRLNFDIMIFTGWVFTKNIFEHILDYRDFENNDENSNLKVLLFPDMITMIVFKNLEIMKENIKKLPLEYKKVSDLNINKIIETDNGVEIEYYTHVINKDFEERPKAIEDIIKDE